MPVHPNDYSDSGSEQGEVTSETAAEGAREFHERDADFGSKMRTAIMNASVSTALFANTILPAGSMSATPAAYAIQNEAPAQVQTVLEEAAPASAQENQQEAPSADDAHEIAGQFLDAVHDSNEEQDKVAAEIDRPNEVTNSLVVDPNTLETLDTLETIETPEAPEPEDAGPADGPTGGPVGE